MQYEVRDHPQFSACGLNCGLCPRYHMAGKSKCPGCAGEGFSSKHPACGVLSCCQRRGLQYCYQCDDFTCKRYAGADLSDSFITHKNQLRDLEKAKSIGSEAYINELDRKMELLRQLLAGYDDGRRKSFYCVAVNLLDLQDLAAVMETIAQELRPGMAANEKAAVAVGCFQAMADKRGASLKLRNKKP